MRLFLAGLALTLSLTGTAMAETAPDPVDPAAVTGPIAHTAGEGAQFQQMVHRLPYTKKQYAVAYFEAGAYWEFSDILTALRAAIDRDSDGRLLAFPDAFHYSPGWNLSEQAYDAIAKSIMDNPDVDMVVAMGSMASKALLRHNTGKPVICLDVANPELVGLIDPKTGRSTAANFFADYVPNKWSKSITLMDMLQHIHKIGTLSSNTDAGRTYSNTRELREVGRERGFEVVTYEELDTAESVEACRKGIETLIGQGIDALYVPAVNCFDPDTGNPALLYDILHSHKVKTYAKDGRVPVENGALIGISTLNYDSIGRFFADILLRHVVPGRPAHEATLPFEPKIYLNQVTARKLRIHFPTHLLINVDGVYDATLPDIRDWP